MFGNIRAKQKQLAVLSCPGFSSLYLGVMLTGVPLSHGSLYLSWETNARWRGVTGRKREPTHAAGEKKRHTALVS